MINLIPNEEKKKMSKDFYLRLVGAFFTMLGSSLLVASALLIPSYFVASSRENLINGKLALQKNEPILLPDKDTTAIIKDLKNKLVLIENTEKNKSVFSKRVIDEILSKKLSSIKITKISYVNGGDTGEGVNIRGTALSREDLLLFRIALQNDIAFSSVDLPISNFVKGSNITFNLSLVPSPDSSTIAKVSQ